MRALRALLEQMLKTGDRLHGAFHPLDYLTGISSQCSFIEPCKSIYAELGRLEEQAGAMLSFTPASRWRISKNAAWRCSAMG